jgi:hypothetical protein
MYLRYVRIRDDDEGEVAQRLNAVGEARRQNREGEVGRREQLLRGERWLAVSGLPHDSQLSRAQAIWCWSAYLTRSARVSGYRGKLARREMSLSVTVSVCSPRTVLCANGCRRRAIGGQHARMIRDWIMRGRCTCAVIVVVERVQIVKKMSRVSARQASTSFCGRHPSHRQRRPTSTSTSTSGLTRQLRNPHR